MRTRRLGDSGLLVTELALGTMTFGAETDDQRARLDEVSAPPTIAYPCGSIAEMTVDRAGA
jgi:hypothetical protein